jgi:DNA-binding LacI/PurR family transcriptional regulator
MTNVDECELNPEACRIQNVEAVKNVIAACEKTGAHLAYDAMYGAGQNAGRKLFPQAKFLHCDFNQDYAYYATQELLAMKKRPDAIFTISDRMAIGAMLAIKKKGLQMPTDIGLVGFNNEPVTGLVTPSISSVEMPSFEMGKAAAKLFIETMHNKESASNIEKILPPKLIIRESSLKFSV